ncbi:hypothetical protein [Mesorhizobium sp. M7A.F.Ca.MR.362.00.0.0]|uniref:hypothetical protein n=1 Tax=Mesorhizobium sp. M7A.F.Ca.MR.362.00.0.0 TaxID=2496779 RepID=UPI000FD34590|nr:hypothetical protein [Mesorhizobium sp. M7A.F.Ca.MR.362.00.0.0]RUU79993.1 hypothetical protein EOC06_13860 [Mesorhizobium sp. M7A.F.Ca.MR.362.00.0.0]
MDREAENKRMNDTLDAIDPRRAFVNARRICARRYQRSPNWVLAMELFGLGSTYSFALCRRFGIDPESCKLTAS